MSQGGFGDDIREIKLPRPPIRRIGSIILGLILLAVISSAWYTVGPEENGIVLRFGQFVRTRRATASAS